MNAPPKDIRMALFMPTDLIAAVDEWRRSQADLPNRSEAIRRLIARGIERQDQ